MSVLVPPIAINILRDSLAVRSGAFATTLSLLLPDETVDGQKDVALCLWMGEWNGDKKRPKTDG